MPHLIRALLISLLFFSLLGVQCVIHSLNVSTTRISVMGYLQCLPLSVVQLKGKHCQKPHCRNGVVDMLGHVRVKSRTPSEGKIQIDQKIWAGVADKICFGRA